jgi:release factor glutamine methyltransferase
MESERFLDEEEWGRVQELVAERRKGRPLAYITNRREFLSEDFYVDDRVLIPRPETELLVEEALSFMKGREDRFRVLDVGTGSGIIGIMLAKGGARDVVSVDISPGAISVARMNSRMLGVEARTSFIVSDLLSGIGTHCHPFDLVCANLPYVTADEYAELMDDVRCYEPKEALVGGTDGMDLYKRLIENLGSRICSGGAILCEIGGEAQAEALSTLLRSAGFEVTVKNDLAGRQRVVKGLWKSSL